MSQVRTETKEVISAADLELARKQYIEDGATVLRGVISRDWIERLSDATERHMAGGSGNDFARPGSGRFYEDVFVGRQVTTYRDFFHQSVIAELAGRLMGSREVRFFYDQLLVKEPGTPKPTPWHQDLPYWPLSGEQVISFWVPLDPATPETGVVTYVKGSHRWNAFYPPEEWADDPDPAKQGFGTMVTRPGHDATGKQERTLADIRDNPDRYEFSTWSVEPGDVIVHHAETIHGAPGNSSQNTRRRAIATRWAGDDARWDDSRPHFFRLMRNQADFPYPTGLKTGDRLLDPLFPVVWSK